MYTSAHIDLDWKNTLEKSSFRLSEIYCLITKLVSKKMKRFRKNLQDPDRDLMFSDQSLWRRSGIFRIEKHSTVKNYDGVKAYKRVGDK